MTTATPTKTKTRKPSKSEVVADDLFAKMTQRLIDSIENNPTDWARPWKRIEGAWRATNPTTGNAYKGMNQLILVFEANDKAYSTNYWAGYKQWQKVGAQVRKGEKATWGINWSKVTKNRTDADGNNVIGPDGKPVTYSFMVPRPFKVWNADQCELGEYKLPEPEELTETERVAAIDLVVDSCGATIKHGAQAAYYNPAADSVHMPIADAFHTTEGYYSTLFHELAHWTGHSSRLDRLVPTRFGAKDYAYEELVAELSAVFTCGSLGLDSVDRPDHAAYLAHWLKGLKEDPRFLQSVASKAEAATAYVLA